MFLAKGRQISTSPPRQSMPPRYCCQLQAHKVRNLCHTHCPAKLYSCYMVLIVQREVNENKYGSELLAIDFDILNILLIITTNVHFLQIRHRNLSTSAFKMWNCNI